MDCERGKSPDKKDQLVERREELSSFQRRAKLIVETRTSIRALKGKRGLLQLAKELVKESSDLSESEKQEIFRRYDELGRLIFSPEDLCLEGDSQVAKLINRMAKGYEAEQMDVSAEALIKRDLGFLEKDAGLEPSFSEADPEKVLDLIQKRIEALDAEMAEEGRNLKDASKEADPKGEKLLPPPIPEPDESEIFGFLPDESSFLERSEVGRSIPQDLDSLYKEGIRGRDRKALRDGIMKNPTNHAFYRAVGSIETRGVLAFNAENVQKMEDGLAFLRMAIEIAPDDMYSYYNLYQALQNITRSYIAVAKEEAKKGVAPSADYEQKKIEVRAEGRQLLRRMLFIEPDSNARTKANNEKFPPQTTTPGIPKIYLRVAEYFKKIGNRPHTLLALEKAYTGQWDKGSVDHWDDYGEALENARFYKQAKVAYETALELLEVEKPSDRFGISSVIHFIESKLDDPFTQYSSRKAELQGQLRSLAEAEVRHKEDARNHFMNGNIVNAFEYCFEQDDAELFEEFYWAESHEDRMPLVNHPASKNLLKKAILAGAEKIILLLLVKGVRIEEADSNGWTSMMTVVELGDTELAKKLVQVGAYVNVTDHNGWTPLMVAACRGYADMITFLCSAGANPEMVNNQGETARMIAEEYGNGEAVERIDDRLAEMRREKERRSDTDETRLSQINKAMDRGDFPEAIELFGHLGEQYRNEVQLDKLAEAYFETGQFDEALACIREILRRYPNDDAYLMYAAAHFVTYGFYSEALECYSHALSLNTIPEEEADKVRIEMARIETLQTQGSKSLKDQLASSVGQGGVSEKKVNALSPEQKRVEISRFGNSANQEYLAGNFEAALELYREILKIEPTHPYALLMVGDLTGDLHEALQKYRYAYRAYSSIGNIDGAALCFSKLMDIQAELEKMNQEQLTKKED